MARLLFRELPRAISVAARQPEVGRPRRVWCSIARANVPPRPQRRRAICQLAARTTAGSVRPAAPARDQVEDERIEWFRRRCSLGSAARGARGFVWAAVCFAAPAPCVSLVAAGAAQLFSLAAAAAAASSHKQTNCRKSAPTSLRAANELCARTCGARTWPKDSHAPHSSPSGRRASRRHALADARARATARAGSN